MQPNTYTANLRLRILIQWNRAGLWQGTVWYDGSNGVIDRPIYTSLLFRSKADAQGDCMQWCKRMHPTKPVTVWSE